MILSPSSASAISSARRPSLGMRRVVVLCMRVNKRWAAGQLPLFGKKLARPQLGDRSHVSQSVVPRDGNGPLDEDKHAGARFACREQPIAGGIAPHLAETAKAIDLSWTELWKHLLAAGMDRRHGRASEVSVTATNPRDPITPDGRQVISELNNGQDN
jgi:hypothetical protein